MVSFLALHSKGLLIESSAPPVSNETIHWGPAPHDIQIIVFWMLNPQLSFINKLSVVWDSQFATSFTLYMYTDCLEHRAYNLHVHVFGNEALEFKYPLTELFISDTNFEKGCDRN